MPFLCFVPASASCHSSEVISRVDQSSPQHHVVHLSWEYPPVMTGGLGVACAGLVGGLESSNCNWSVSVLHAGMLLSGQRSSSYAYAAVAGEGGDLDALRAALADESAVVEDSLRELMRFSRFVIAHPLARGATLIHAHDWHAALAAEWLQAEYGIPYVFHMHSCELERQGIHARSLVYEIETRALGSASAVVCVSRNSTRFVAQHYQFPFSRITVVHNAVSDLDSNQSEESAQSSGNTVLFAGRLCSQKAPELMLEIFRKLLVSEPTAQLLIAGEGEEMQSLRAVVEFCGLQKQVEFLGMIPREKMPSVYCRADVLCLPSLAEPFGLVAAEAYACGLDVIVSENCGVAEVLGDITVLPSRAIDHWNAALLECFAERKKEGSKGQKKAASRIWRDAAGEMIALYERLIKRA